jgi:hypothetical protein
MAPRVDRPVARVFPARWSSLTRTARLVSETDRDLERHRNPFGHPRPEFLSLFKGQGAAPMATWSSGVAARGGRLAQLVRALP